jgi:hypothetical protein
MALRLGGLEALRRLSPTYSSAYDPLTSHPRHPNIGSMGVKCVAVRAGGRYDPANGRIATRALAPLHRPSMPPRRAPRFMSSCCDARSRCCTGRSSCAAVRVRVHAAMSSCRPVPSHRCAVRSRCTNVQPFVRRWQGFLPRLHASLHARPGLRASPPGFLSPTSKASCVADRSSYLAASSAVTCFQVSCHPPPGLLSPNARSS